MFASKSKHIFIRVKEIEKNKKNPRKIKKKNLRAIMLCNCPYEQDHQT